MSNFLKKGEVRVPQRLLTAELTAMINFRCCTTLGDEDMKRQYCNSKTRWLCCCGCWSSFSNHRFWKLGAQPLLALKDPVSLELLEHLLLQVLWEPSRGFVTCQKHGQEQSSG